MTNEAIVNDFLQSYKNHDWKKMHGHLDKTIKFSDFAFDIAGEEVKAMWHWFSIGYGDRKDPVEILEIKKTQSKDDIVFAKYNVHYLIGERIVDYWIRSTFNLNNDKIVEQIDAFDNISQFKFALMVSGMPAALLSLTPLFRSQAKKKQSDKLERFMLEFGYSR